MSIKTIIFLLFVIVGFFTYDGITGSLGMALLFISSAICIGFLSCIIPFIGWIISIVITWFIIFPAVLSYTGLYSTVLTYGMFIYLIIMGLIVSIKTVLFIIELITKWNDQNDS